MNLHDLGQSLNSIIVKDMVLPEDILRLMVNRHMASQNAHIKVIVQEAANKASVEAVTSHLEQLKADMLAMRENLRVLADDMAQLGQATAEREWKERAFKAQAEARQRRMAYMRRREVHKGNQNFTDWKAECRIVFADKPSMKSLPLPALPRCSRVFCYAYSTTTACRHNVEQFLRGSGQYSTRLLKGEITTWHPDKFSTCSQQSIEKLQAEATPFYRILHDLYLHAKETGYS